MGHFVYEIQCDEVHDEDHEKSKFIVPLHRRNGIIFSSVYKGILASCQAVKDTYNYVGLAALQKMSPF